ncbi:MAG: alpha/beta fold hydrolase [Actinomycetales bacterium]
MTPLVLVHGAWHTSLSWRFVKDELTKAGASATAVDLPGRDNPTVAATASLDDVVGVVLDTITGVGEPVVLVGHSLSGVVIDHVAQRLPQQVAQLVHIASFVPPPGQRVLDVASWSSFARSMALLQQIDFEQGTSSFPSQSAAAAFYGELDATEAAEAAAQLVTDGLAVSACTAAAPVPGMERTYVECLRDRAIPIEAQREMCRTGAITRVITMDTDHSPFLSRPHQLTGHLLEVAGGPA